MPLRKALLGACLALPLVGFAGAAHAGSSQGERIIQVPAGSVVLMLPGAAMPRPADMTAMPAFDAPMLPMIAAQEAMVRQMLLQVRALDRMAAFMPDPGALIRAATAGMPPPRIAPGTSVVTTVVSNGHGVCRETVTWRTDAADARPDMHVVRDGNACGALTMTGPAGVTQTLPAQPARQPENAPALRRHHLRLWSVGYPAHALPAHAPRT